MIIKSLVSCVPIGLMKALVVRYGPNVERLKEESGVDVLELILRQYKLRVQGTRAAFDRLTRWIGNCNLVVE